MITLLWLQARGLSERNFLSRKDDPLLLSNTVGRTRRWSVLDTHSLRGKPADIFNTIYKHSQRGWRWSLVFYSSFKTMFKTFFSRFSFVLGVFIFTNSNICFCTCKTLTDLQHYQKCNNVNFFKPWIFILVMVDNVEQYDVSTFDSFQPRCSTTIEHFDNQYTFVYRHISLLRSESLNQRVCWFHF